jgi:hypothetical protein
MEGLVTCGSSPVLEKLEGVLPPPEIDGGMLVTGK